jgi:hypothetical protein
MMLLSDNPVSDIAVIAVDLNEWAVHLGVPAFLQISGINCEKLFLSLARSCTSFHTIADLDS